MKKVLCLVFAFLAGDIQPLVSQEIKLADKIKYRNDGGVSSIAFSPDEKTLAAVCWFGGARKQTGELVLWNVATKKESGRVNLGPGRAELVAFTPDGKLLAVAYRDATSNTNKMKILYAQITDQGSWGKDRLNIVLTGGKPTALAVSRDSKTLIVGTGWLENGSSELLFLDMETGKEIARLPGGRNFVESLSLSSDGKLLASCSDDKVQFWDMTTFKERNSLPAGRGYSVALSPDGSLIALRTTGSRKYPGLDALTIRDSLTGIAKVGITQDFGIRSMLFMANGKKLIFSTSRVNNADINIVDVETGKLISKVDGGALLGRPSILATAGNWIASAHFDATISLWDISSLMPMEKKKHIER